MAGELNDMDQAPDWVVDRLVAWHYLRHPDQARDGVIAELREKYNIPPDRGMPMADAAIIRSQGWTREQAEALSDALEGWPDLPVPLTAVPVLPPFPAGVYPPWIEAEISALAESTQTPRDLAAMVVLGVLATACSPPCRSSRSRPAGPSRPTSISSRRCPRAARKSPGLRPAGPAAAERREDPRRQGEGGDHPQAD